jgi:molybdopterin-guanine dinucleotide biosynthesis protein
MESDQANLKLEIDRLTDQIAQMVPRTDYEIVEDQKRAAENKIFLMEHERADLQEVVDRVNKEKAQKRQNIM